MQKILTTSLGVLLMAGAVSAFADKQDRENLAACKEGINAYYGDDARTRLRSIKRSSGESQFRLMVNPRGGSNTVVVCAVDDEGALRLQNGDGVALVKESSEQAVSLVE
jgi:hypothetical protein